MKLGIIFGGKSTEHEVSVVSATNIIKNLNQEKYEIYPIYINKEGSWFHLNEEVTTTSYSLGTLPTNITPIENVVTFLKTMDIVFPVLHGLYGEDGTIEGMLKLFDIPFVGCAILASSICMDKVYTKLTLKSAGIKVVPDLYIKGKKNDYYYINEAFEERKVSFDDIDLMVKETLSYPVFVKPSNSGSSVGVAKAQTKEELISSITNASKYDEKILIEKAIVGRELECAVLLGKASEVGEVLSAEEFYSFNAKYQNSASKTKIPADIENTVSEKIKAIAEKAFRAVDASGLARIDFFFDEKNETIYLNEINTMPGFTEISMYPKLIEQTGISQSELLDKLIQDAVAKR